MTKLIKDVFPDGYELTFDYCPTYTGTEETFGFIFTTPEPCIAICDAVNQHDTLTEQNKQLVENFQVLIHEMKQELVRGSYAVDTESGSSMVISIPAVNSEISKITRALIDDDYMNSILAKHKE